MSIRCVLGAVALALSLVACSSPIAGSPSAVAPNSTSATTSQDPFAGLSPCALLDQALKADSFPPAAPSSADPQHACDISKPSYGGVTLGLQAGANYLANMGDPSKVKTGDINGRPAVQIRERLGSKGACEVYIQVKTHSRAVVIVTLVSRSTDAACDYAGKAAAKIESALPN